VVSKILNEVWSKSERRKRAKKCKNPHGFTMKQFCKNTGTRSKKGQKTNEIIEAIFTRLLQEELKVKASIRPSEISDMGLFAGEDIPQGTVVFDWNNQVDQEYSLNYPDMLPSATKKEFMDLASVDNNGWFLAGDGAAYFNHSENPNVSVDNGPISPAKRTRRANRDINAGEELTMDYAEIGSDVPKRTFER
jgi:SET domain-containing protein